MSNFVLNALAASSTDWPAACGDMPAPCPAMRCKAASRSFTAAAYALSTALAPAMVCCTADSTRARPRPLTVPVGMSPIPSRSAALPASTPSFDPNTLRTAGPRTLPAPNVAKSMAAPVPTFCALSPMVRVSVEPYKLRSKASYASPPTCDPAMPPLTMPGGPPGVPKAVPTAPPRISAGMRPYSATSPQSGPFGLTSVWRLVLGLV